MFRCDIDTDVVLELMMHLTVSVYGRGLLSCWSITLRQVLRFECIIYIWSLFVLFQIFIWADLNWVFFVIETQVIPGRYLSNNKKFA